MIMVGISCPDRSFENSYFSCHNINLYIYLHLSKRFIHLFEINMASQPRWAVAGLSGFAAGV